MAQFDVCRNTNPVSQRQVPYLLVLQHDLLDDFPSAIVAPLKGEGSPRAIPRLQPVFEIDGNTFVLATSEMAAAPRKFIGKPVANLAARRDEIIAAIDLVFTGI